MSNFIVLPCGCRITETHVLGMCGTHVMELHQKNVEHEKRYSYYRALMDREASSGRRSGGHS
jgi:hypothetical protein